MIRGLVLAAILCLPLACRGERHGELLWDPGMDPAAYRNAEGKVKRLMFPEVPEGGRPPPDVVLVGVIDSGVIDRHPQLEGFIAERRDFTGEGLDDVIGHGTAVTLLAVFGVGTGRPVASVLSAKVVDRNGRIAERNLVDAIHWVASRGARVVNLSLGFKGTRDDNRAICEAIATHPETLFVAAAGNFGPDVAVYPAGCGEPNVLSVEAADPGGNAEPYSGKGEVRGPGTARFLPEPRYWYARGQELARSGDLKRARSYYERSIEAEPNPESEYQIGLIELRESNTAAGITRFQQAIAMFPEFAEAHEMLGAALYLSRDYGRAETSLRNALDLYPDVPETTFARARTHFNLGQVLLARQRRAEALEEFLQTRDLAPLYPRIDEVLREVGKGMAR
jgi:hypothetical protein